MKEYISREAAIEACCGGCNPAMCSQNCDEVDAIRSLPAADVRPVVLCRNCKHRDPEDHKCDCGGLERAGCIFSVDDDYFCAYGEKR